MQIPDPCALGLCLCFCNHYEIQHMWAFNVDIFYKNIDVISCH